jgi:hypothetical protein
MNADSPVEYMYEASQVENKLMSKAHELQALYYFTTVGQSECTPIQYQRIIKSSWVGQSRQRQLATFRQFKAANVCGLTLRC